ncbi:MAG: tRNA (guanine-N1)-methyltransferase [Thermoproteus sp.]|jgi:tRNA (adenine9-N1/guanine9-N1)-methyltransferase
MAVGVLGDMLRRELERMGVQRLAYPRRFKCRHQPEQCAAVGLLLGRYKLCRFPDGVALVGSGMPCPEPVHVELKPPEFPKIYIDLGLWGIHTDSEKNELVEQIAAAIASVRRELWDGNLVLTRAPAEFLERFGRAMRGMRHAVAIAGGPPPRDGLVLDPEGPCVADEALLRGADEIVVGGVVDKERIYKGATARIAAEIGVPDGRRCRIELRGSTVGVPDRLNKIIEIVLAVRFAGLSLEEAVIAAQARRDKVYRLMREFQRAGRCVDPALADELARWLKADRRAVELAAAKAHVEIGCEPI